MSIKNLQQLKFVHMGQIADLNLLIWSRSNGTDYILLAIKKIYVPFIAAATIILKVYR